jgi:hypothetical protein
MTLGTPPWCAPRQLLGIAAVLAGFAAGPAFADCKSDLVATQKGLQATGVGVEEVAKAPDAGKCPAHRKHYAAMVKFRDLLGRCDSGASKADNLTKLNASIEDFRKKMPAGCKP